MHVNSEKEIWLSAEEACSLLDIKKDKQIERILNELDPCRQRFLNKNLNFDKDASDFLKIIEQIDKKLDYKGTLNQSDKSKEKIKRILDSVLKSENYKLFKKIEKEKIEKEIRNKELEIKKEQEKQKAKILIDKIEQYKLNDDLASIEQIYNNNLTLLKKYEESFCSWWCNLPRNYYKPILHNRKIKYLVHFTNIENLESILKNGILPLAELAAENIKHISNDKLRLDDKANCSCLSIEFPNKFLLDIFRKKYDQNKFCMIILNAEKVILNNLSVKYFIYCNAARDDARNWLKRDYLNTESAFENMFIEKNPDYRYPYTRAEKQLKSYLPTDLQAEILFEGNIKTNCIEKIYFETKEHLNLFKEKMTDKSLLKQYTFELNSSFFQNERDEIDWRDR